ncbi:hypothetical protein ACWEQL_39870 [Kitasatospora sp. NPDC004240]
MSLPSPAARPTGTAPADAPVGGTTDGPAGGAATDTDDAADGPDGAGGDTPDPAPGSDRAASDHHSSDDASVHDDAADAPCGSAAARADAQPDATAEWDLLTDDVRWSPETFRLLGCDPGQGPLSLDRLPDRLTEADRPLLRRMMTDALVHGRCPVGLVRVPGLGPVACEGEPVLGTDGTVTALRMWLRAA